MSDNIEQISRSLLDESPESWPENLRPLRVPLRTVPGEARENILSMIRSAQEEEKSARVVEFPGGKSAPSGSGKKLFRFSLAALIPLGAILGAVFLYTGSMDRTGDPRIGRLIGSVRIIREGKTESGGQGGLLRSGSRIELGRNGVLTLALDGSLFLLRGPGRFRIQRTSGSEKGELEIFIQSGEIAVYSGFDASGKTSQERFVWRDEDARYRMTGTMARLERDESGASLAVLEGSFSVRFLNRKDRISVRSGEILRYAAGFGKAGAGKTLPRTRGMNARERFILQELKKDVQGLRRGAPYRADRPLSSRKLETTGAIRTHYGRIYRIHLEDRTYVGYPRYKGAVIRIHTTLGIIEVNRDLVRKIEETRR